MFWTQVQRSGVQIPSFPRFFYFFSVFSFSGQVRVQTPLEFTWFFSYVESYNLYHLWVFGLITDLYQSEKVQGNFVGIKIEFWPVWCTCNFYFLMQGKLLMLNSLHLQLCKLDPIYLHWRLTLLINFHLTDIFLFLPWSI